MKTQFTKSLLCLAFIVVGLIFTQSVRADQGNMDAALRDLRNARAHLADAERDKGGHRTQAVQLIDQAIEQVKLGIDAGHH